MIVVSRWGLIARRIAAVMTIAHGALVCPSVLSAQSPGRLPSLLDQGTGAAQFGRCQADVLRDDMLRSAAVLGAFAPEAVDRLVRRTDELTVIALMCAHQIHQHRCTAKIVAVAGDVLVASSPGGKAIPPEKPNPGAVLGGTVGALGGVLLGTTREGLGTGLGAGVIGGAIGYQGGAAIFNKAQMDACIGRQRELDAISAKLEGSVPDVSLATLDAFIRSNVGARISERDATVLITEANKLSQRAFEVFKAMR